MSEEIITAFSLSFISLHKNMMVQTTVTARNTEDMISNVYEFEDSA